MGTRLTEWLDGEKSRAHITLDAGTVPMFEVYNRLAEYEDIGSVDECRRNSEVTKRLETYMHELGKILER